MDQFCWVDVQYLGQGHDQGQPVERGASGFQSAPAAGADSDQPGDDAGTV